MKRRLAGFVLCVSIVGLSSCAGASGVIRFEGLTYPASMSSSLYDRDDRVVTAGEELEVVGEFEYEKSLWGIAYGAVPLSGDSPISAAMNEKIAACQGDGMVNVAVIASDSIMNTVTYLLWLHWLPITPGCVSVKVTGQVVRVKPAR